MTKRGIWIRKKNVEEWTDETKEKKSYGYIQGLKNWAESKMKDKSSVYWGVRLLALAMIFIKVFFKK